MLSHLTSWQEVHAMFMALPNDKASGHDGATAEHFKHAPQAYHEALLPVINGMIDGNFPDETKLGVIVPTSKNKERFRPLHLLQIIYRAVDHRIASRLLDAIQDLGIAPPDQHGSLRGSGPPTPIDLLLVIAEDSHFYGREAWVNLLDCSEAFDSQTNAATDIVLASAGLPERFIIWARRAKNNQRRVISTAGGLSDPADPVRVLGGSQGSSTMPVLWCIATRAILSFSQSLTTAGYTPR